MPNCIKVYLNFLIFSRIFFHSCEVVLNLFLWLLILSSYLLFKRRYWEIEISIPFCFCLNRQAGSTSIKLEISLILHTYSCIILYRHDCSCADIWLDFFDSNYFKYSTILLSSDFWLARFTYLCRPFLFAFLIKSPALFLLKFISQRQANVL